MLLREMLPGALVAARDARLWVRRIMAARCDGCTLCRFARQHPGGLVGRAVKAHGRFCPFWHAWERVHSTEPRG